jgi:hypothetical protein
MSYAADLSTSGNIAELFEGVDDDDEMFWMILGSDDYAKADHWRWRSNTTASEPKLWRYDSSLAPHPVGPFVKDSLPVGSPVLHSSHS